GISAAVAVPVQALGKVLGVMYADCVRDGAVMTAEDLQRIAFVSRILASALGNRVLVQHLLVNDGDQAGGHWALETHSAACAQMVQHVKLYAPADYTVLLRGETGTGKEVIARALHDLSHRAKGPFVPVNCAAIPEQLMESMLFGHEKGSFTGAAQTRRGHFEEAHGGTIFLDEIGDMAVELQAKILRVLQDRVVIPIGGRRQIKVDVRILAATHQDLEQMVKAGRFREDLYYRLRELQVVLPALRERREDLEMLITRFLNDAVEELGLSERPQLHPEAMALLARHPFRGNIRELQHLLKGAVLRAQGGRIMVAHLELEGGASGSGAAGAGAEAAAEAEGGGNKTWKQRLEAQEKVALQRTMGAADGNLTRAAEMFGVPRTTYREKLVRHGLLDS
ncbi:MAG: sigma-54 dependent transcriptional regulator, partial [Planctomycetota bacterium]|nr:sigma-54 dependent transcriptional regulator [Planctomycetota bacterium]